MKMLTCRDCGECKPETAFTREGDAFYPGVMRISPACRECRFPAYTTTRDPETGHLRCSCCREWKVPELFAPAPPSKVIRKAVQARGGRNWYCRDCVREKHREYDHSPQGREADRRRKRRQLRQDHTPWQQRPVPVHPSRRYFPAAGDMVYVHGVLPTLIGYVVTVDPSRATARVRTDAGTDTYRWTEFRSYEAHLATGRKAHRSRRSDEPSSVTLDAARQERIRDLRAQGCSYRQISRETGCCWQTIRKYLGPPAEAKMGRPPLFGPDALEEMRRQVEQGRDYQAIAREFGCSRPTLYYHFGPARQWKEADR
jgi:hypothetical protein